MTSSSWHFRMLGSARLHASGHDVIPLERKAAALLAMLALEGPTRRAHLTALLWPETREASARNNLVHLLRKLRAVSGADLVVGAELLALAEHVTVDVTRVRDVFMRGEYGAVGPVDAEVLQGLVYDDCPDLDEWVQAQRERWAEWRRIALRGEVRRLESEGAFDEALTRASALLTLDPVSEDAWRRVMRLHYLRGDRPAALRAFHACVDVLRRELSVEPMPETKDLARLIDQGRVPVVPRLPVDTTLPITVLRPPVLVGREREWAQLEAAWRAGVVAFVQGPPGVGKSRLARDFAASKGEFLMNEGRPGDFRQPKSASARAFQEIYSKVRGVPVADWVKREMSRYLPEFVEAGFEAPPITSETTLLRFRQAMLEFLRITTGRFRTHLIDDWQYFDLASLEDGMYMYTSGRMSGESSQDIAPLICTFRAGELPFATEAIMREMIEGGHAVLIDVPPLDDRHVQDLLDSLGVNASESVRRGLSRYSGGNPHFLLETVKHLLENRQLEGTFPRRLPPPKSVARLVARRLERLSPPALQVARAAAVLQSDFDVEQVAAVLGAPLLDTASAWEELEAAQIMHGERFTHDLVYEAVEADIPATVRPLLHRSAAKVLEGARGPAARIAYHWQEGLKRPLAASWFERAAHEAFDEFRHADAARFLEAAATIFEELGEFGRAVEVRERLESVRDFAKGVSS